MADQHHESNPNIANSIASDISDILECQKYHWDVFQMLLGVHATTLASISPPGPQRSKFTFVDADTITIGPGIYFHDGTTRQTVFWDADITFDLGSGGSNALSDDLGASEWHYIYLDDSAIVTQALPELDADCFLNDTTAPTWSDAKHGWYNGSDKCIFAVLTSGANAVLQWWHDGGDFVYFDTAINELSATDIDTTWIEVDCKTSVPEFSTRMSLFALLEVKTADALVYAYLRPEGSTATTGATQVGLERIGTDQQITVLLDTFLDSAQIFEVKLSRSGADTIRFDTRGWYLPTGF